MVRRIGSRKGIHCLRGWKARNPRLDGLRTTDPVATLRRCRAVGERLGRHPGPWRSRQVTGKHRCGSTRHRADRGCRRRRSRAAPTSSWSVRGTAASAPRGSSPGAGVASSWSKPVASGSGASTRNGGMVIPELKRGPRELARRYGPLGGELVDAVLDAFSLLEGVVDEQAIDCDYRRTGALVVAHHRRSAREPARRRATSTPTTSACPRGSYCVTSCTTSSGPTSTTVASCSRSPGVCIPRSYHAGLFARGARRGRRRPRADARARDRDGVATKACASSPRGDRSKPPTCSSRPTRTRTI